MIKNQQINFILNEKTVLVEINPAQTVLDFLRSEIKLTGTKEGCREGDCGACTVLIGSLIKNKVVYKTVNSCLMPVADLNGKHLVTIEGLNKSGLSLIQEEMVDEGGTQCGFCTPGFIMSITGYFLRNEKFNIKEALDVLDGNICRCTGYAGIKRAVSNVVEKLNHTVKNKKGIEYLISCNVIPAYFLEIQKKLKNINQQTVSTRKEKFKFKNVNIISGGTDLYVQKWEELLEVNADFIYEREDLNRVYKEKDSLFVGGNVSINEFQNSIFIKKYFPFLQNHINLFGSLSIRNRATIAGNIVNASPIADITNILIVLNAKIILVDSNKEKVIPIDQFYLDYKKTVMKKNELIKAVSINIPKRYFLFNYEKVSRRIHLDIASVNSTIGIIYKQDKIIEASISAGGVAPIPLKLKSASEYLLGRSVSIPVIKQTAEIALQEISPITDARGTAEYKTILLRQLIYAHFIKLFPKIINAKELI